MTHRDVHYLHVRYSTTVRVCVRMTVLLLLYAA
jgi:hypothetical protein